MHSLAYRKVFGLLGHWVILKNEEDYKSIIEMCKAAGAHTDAIEIYPDPPKRLNYPVMALFKDITDGNYCGIGVTYVDIGDCKDFLEAAGFVVEMSEELKNKPVEW